jgi:hypothetical protein
LGKKIINQKGTGRLQEERKDLAKKIENNMDR